jgi:flagellar assembly protein FliH
MSTSSSATARQPLVENHTSALPFPYVDATTAEIPNEPVIARDDRNQLQAEVLEQARQQGRQEARTELSAALAQGREQVDHALDEFARERSNYYRRVEAEVVQLALAIARKILHREVQLDPHALTGIVRVTLEGMDAGTKVSLHVPSREAADWRHDFASKMEGDVPLEIREDSNLASGECRIESALGATAVGFASQLKEIETGLLDLLAERPGSS